MSDAIAGLKMVNINTNTTTVLKAFAGTLVSVVVNNPGTTETITIYDNNAASGTVLALITVGTVPISLTYNGHFWKGLTVVTAGGAAADITVSFS